MNDDRVRGAGVRISRRSWPVSSRLVFGAVVLTLGLLWTAENLGLLDADEVLRLWPVALIALGVVRLLGIDGQRRWTSGLLFTFVGAWMLARALGLVEFSILRLWPVFLIIMGTSLVWRSLRGDVPRAHVEQDDYPRPFALMGGVVRPVQSQQLVGLEASAVMGGVELDLRGARSRDPEVVAEVFTWWGGIELVVPDNWRVVTEATPVMGGVDDQTRLSVPDPVTTLVLRGVVIMGGVEVRNAPSRAEEFRGVRVGVSRPGGRKEVRVDASGVTITRERDPQD